MGLCSRYKSLTCNSCSMHCQMSPRLQYCANSCFCMWTEESSYFNRGVVEGILTKNHNARLSGYIFVDFSVSFLRLFLEKDWIDYLASTDMGIVLVSDRNMQSLANYWRKHNSAISAVIYNDDGLDVANEKIRQLFIGRYLSFTRGNTLTQMEFTIMGYMVSGYNPYQIAEVLDMDIRSIYAYKQRIEKRMGGKINELFIRSHSVQH
ncbi:helix-turn-helix transcriptional regulator [Escherichia coli]|nr:helix-turn-helix transcriptional regulator [Escherichia coli]EID8898697.1 helix-turn-helix transcriptional regulator [Escherichia coli]EIG7283974.1 helix-turn-helix transcriptional regulator [Escherichia coli]EKL1249546.1 helix-turn-helix transcriptional regulator [Escherichia coli]EKP7858308.1 helix-turn-helix transcriptional regulator [Escherichia coli]